MDESALKHWLDSLEICRSSLDSWLFFWTLLVVIGVALEVIFVVWEYREDLHAFRRGIIRPPTKPGTSLLIFGLFGSALVAIGVTGELWVGAKIGSVETKIRKANGDLTTLLSKEAGDAKASAKGAAVAAATAKSSADAAGVAADKAQARVETVSEREATAETELERQRQLTAKAETTRLQMQEALEPRSAGTNGKQNDELLLFAGTKFFITFASDTDSQDLASNITGLLKRAEWNPVGAEAYQFSPLVQPPRVLGGANLTLTSSASLFDGVTVMAKPASWDGMDRFRPKDPEAGGAARLVCYILKDSQVACDNFARYRHWPEGLPDEAVWVVVGRKPGAYFKWGSNTEAQQAFMEMEKKNQTNSEDDERGRAALLAQRRNTLKRK